MKQMNVQYKQYQYKTSECGMYCIYFIIQMIKDKESFDHLEKYQHLMTDKLKVQEIKGIILVFSII